MKLNFRKDILGKHKNNKGISLVEALVTVVIFSFIAGGIYATVVVGQDSWEHNKVSTELHQGLRAGMEWMKYDLQQAGSSSISNVPADDAWKTSISFKKPTGVSNGMIIWDTNATQFVKGGSNNDQLQRIYNGTTKVLANNISSLQFRRQSSSSNILEVQIVVQKQTATRHTIQDQLNFEVKLRNN